MREQNLAPGTSRDQQTFVSLPRLTPQSIIHLHMGQNMHADLTHETAATHPADQWPEESPVLMILKLYLLVYMLYICPFLPFLLRQLTSYRRFCDVQPLTGESGLQPLLLNSCRKCEVGSFSLSAPYLPWSGLGFLRFRSGSGTLTETFLTYFLWT